MPKINKTKGVGRHPKYKHTPFALTECHDNDSSGLIINSDTVKLKSNELYIFVFMLKNSDRQKNHVYFNPIEAINDERFKIQYSYAGTVYLVLDQLILKKFIARSKSASSYWINPKYVMYGQSKNDDRRSYLLP